MHHGAALRRWLPHHHPLHHSTPPRPAPALPIRVRPNPLLSSCAPPQLPNCLAPGYYPAGGAPKSNQQAQVDMIDETLKWAGVAEDGAPAPRTAVDVGCGIGGSSRHIAAKYSASTQGITLSPVQAARAGAISERAGLGDQCKFQVADALQQPFADGSFDLVWSLESGEHMPDKP